MKRSVFSTILLFMLVLAACKMNGNVTMPDQGGETVVVAERGDEFFSLAEEIAREEAASLVSDWDAALEGNPEVVLWIASPAALSDEVMVKTGLALKQPSMLPAIGIISGKNLAEARALWQRGRQVRSAWTDTPPDRFFAANAEFPTAGILQSQLIAFLSGRQQTQSMSLPTLIDTLQQADYLTYTGHGSDSYWRLDADTRLEAADLPDLPPLVVTSNGCQTMRPWEEDSIALGFPEKGAAVYGGFVYSPLEGYMVGGFQDLPFRHSWPGFTIGQIAALQNRGAMQGFAAFPFYYLLGDPRIAFQTDPPYELIRDYEQDGVRVLTYRGAPQGFIPVRVEDGGRYHYVDVIGIADTAEGDAFFNANLQAASLNGDKYVLFKHTGGDFTLRLSANPPWYWWISRPLLASFDHITLFSTMNGGGWIIFAAGLLSLGIACLGWWRMPDKEDRPVRHKIRASWITGLGSTGVMGLYLVLRLPVTTINTKPLTIDHVWLVGVFLLSASGCWFYLLAKKWPGKLLALLISVAPALLPAVFGYAVVGGINLLIAQRIGAPVYNYNLGILPMIAAFAWSILMYSVFSFLKRETGAQQG